MVITLCGSTRFKKDFERLNMEFTLQGHVVLLPACKWYADGEEPTEAERKVLDYVYDQKVRMADMVYIINRDGYIGSSTHREISYAQFLGKEIRFMAPHLNWQYRTPEEISHNNRPD